MDKKYTKKDLDLYAMHKMTTLLSTTEGNLEVPIINSIALTDINRVLEGKTPLYEYKAVKKD